MPRPATVIAQRSPTGGRWRCGVTGSTHRLTGRRPTPVPNVTCTDEDLIYELTRVIYENRDQVTAKHAAGKAINSRNVVRDTGTEFHPGAIRYYKEIGIWPEDE